MSLNQVKNDLYEIEGDGGNVAVYLTDEGVILVDDKFEGDYEGIMAHVKNLTSKPVKYVLSTHYHADHSGGNSKFLPTAEIISTANARNAIVSINNQMRRLEWRLRGSYLRRRPACFWAARKCRRIIVVAAIQTAMQLFTSPG